MDTKTYTFIDKSKWPAGPWQSEPDKIQWADADTGLPCLAVRHTGSGHWCGYVGVAAGHPYYGKSWDDLDLSVHGGLTYADYCQHDPTEHGICHIPGAGEPSSVWWLGFDCAHAGDTSPAYKIEWHMGTYKSLDYVRAECSELAQQIRAAAGAPDDASESGLELPRLASGNESARLHSQLPQ